MNTKIHYLYRDADNYKVHNSCVIKGVLTPEQINVILSCCDAGEYFIPNQVGLPERKFEKIDPQVDHCWFELTRDDFEYTDQPATPQIPEPEITAAVLRLYHKLKLGQETVLRPVLSQLQELRERELRSNRKISDIDNEIARISEQNLVLVRLKSKGYVDSALYLSQMDEIDRKLRELRKLRRRLLEAAGEDRQIHDTERMMEYLEDGPEWLDEVPAELFGELIERIIIISPERLKFRLLNGMELAENIERTVR